MERICSLEKLLRKWFGLKGAYYRPGLETEEKICKAIDESGDAVKWWTDEVDESWYKATEMIEDLCEWGFISKAVRDDIICRFCDEA